MEGMMAISDHMAWRPRKEKSLPSLLFIKKSIHKTER